MIVKRFARGFAALLMLAALAGCATLPPAKPTTDLRAIAGKWEGTLQTRQGSVPFTQTIGEDGRVETLIPALSDPGPRFIARVVVEGGRYRWKSETTGRTGTFVLHEGEGRRVLVSRPDDGATHSESTPAK